MRITSNVIEMIRKDNSMQAEIANAMGISVLSLYPHLKRNSDDLTKAAVIEVIERHTGLTREQILEKSVA